MRILIAVPTFESIFPDTFKSIWDLEECGHELLFEFVRGYDCATARNNIVQKAIDLETDFVLMADNDVVLPADALKNLTEDLRDVCLGYYAHRDTDNIYRGRTSICKLHQANGQKYFDYPLESEYTAEELHNLRDDGRYKLQIHGGGMGCAFIKTNLFRRLGYPWFDWVNYRDESRKTLSEDLYFCELCRKAGVPIYTDTRVECGHVLRRVQWP